MAFGSMITKRRRLMTGPGSDLREQVTKGYAFFQGVHAEDPNFVALLEEFNAMATEGEEPDSWDVDFMGSAFEFAERAEELGLGGSLRDYKEASHDASRRKYGAPLQVGDPVVVNGGSLTGTMRGTIVSVDMSSNSAIVETEDGEILEFDLSVLTLGLSHNASETKGFVNEWVSVARGLINDFDSINNNRYMWDDLLGQLRQAINHNDAHAAMAVVDGLRADGFESASDSAAQKLQDLEDALLDATAQFSHKPGRTKGYDSANPFPGWEQFLVDIGLQDAGMMIGAGDFDSAITAIEQYLQGTDDVGWYDGQQKLIQILEMVEQLSQGAHGKSMKSRLSYNDMGDFDDLNEAESALLSELHSYAGAGNAEADEALEAFENGDYLGAASLMDNIDPDLARHIRDFDDWAADDPLSGRSHRPLGKSEGAASFMGLIERIDQDLMGFEWGADLTAPLFAARTDEELVRAAEALADELTRDGINHPAALGELIDHLQQTTAHPDQNPDRRSHRPRTKSAAVQEFLTWIENAQLPGVDEDAEADLGLVLQRFHQSGQSEEDLFSAVEAWAEQWGVDFVIAEVENVRAAHEDEVGFGSSMQMSRRPRTKGSGAVVRVEYAGDMELYEAILTDADQHGALEITEMGGYLEIQFASAEDATEFAEFYNGAEVYPGKSHRSARKSEFGGPVNRDHLRSIAMAARDAGEEQLAKDIERAEFVEDLENALSSAQMAMSEADPEKAEFLEQVIDQLEMEIESGSDLGTFRSMKSWQDDLAKLIDRIEQTLEGLDEEDELYPLYAQALAYLEQDDPWEAVGELEAADDTTAAQMASDIADAMDTGSKSGGIRTKRDVTTDIAQASMLLDAIGLSPLARRLEGAVEINDVDSVLNDLHDVDETFESEEVYDIIAILEDIKQGDTWGEQALSVNNLRTKVSPDMELAEIIDQAAHGTAAAHDVEDLLDSYLLGDISEAQMLDELAFFSERHPDLMDALIAAGVWDDVDF